MEFLNYHSGHLQLPVWQRGVQNMAVFGSLYRQNSIGVAKLILVRNFLSFSQNFLHQSDTRVILIGQSLKF